MPIGRLNILRTIVVAEHLCIFDQTTKKGAAFCAFYGSNPF